MQGAVKNPANESKNESQRSFSGKETKSASHLAQIKSTDKKIDNENKASGSFMERIRRQNTVMNVDTKKKTKSKKRRIKEMISSSEDEETMSNVSNADSAESRTQIYVTKIQKLELELKKLKRENLALKERDLERSLCSKKSPSTPNTPSISVSASSSAKRSLFNSSSANCDYADNTTISQMIVDAYEKKAPLRKDGAGKFTFLNFFMYNFMIEILIAGLFRAKTQINSGSSDKNFLDLSVEKKGKATIRDKLKEAARKFRVEADAKATRTAEVMDSSQDTDADSEMGSKRDEFHLDDGKERSEGSNDKEEDASDVTQLNLDDAEMHSPRDSQTDADDAEMGSGSCSEANSQEDDESDVASKQQDAEVLSQSSRDSVDDMDNLL
ncbi:Halomucin [Frankliniella fusca]|uniref:Halomucin n=1 Tax=Frankliniella fusca TaxID=407009 RepID=A0AAE1H9U3_9NEOP|nr:Halomucin [Frankliniella fusca]